LVACYLERTETMMTPSQVTAAVLEIRARSELKNKGEGVPITEPWAPHPPFVALANPETARGHLESPDPDSGLPYCESCDADKPEAGGWDFGCINGQLRRSFKGS
jgi:hypothetical protein